MSLQASASSDLSNRGKVLVVGVNAGSMDEFKDRVIIRNHWEVFDKPGIPKDVFAICFSGGVKIEYAERIRTLAKSQGIDRFHTEHSPSELRSCIRNILGVTALKGPVAIKPHTEAPPLRILHPEPLAKKLEIPELTAEEIKGATQAPTSRVRAQIGQPRTYFSKRGMDELTESIRANGQITPAIVRIVTDDPDHDYELIEGERRWRACHGLKRPLLICIRNVSNREDQFVTSFAANFTHEGHTPMETARAIEKQMGFEMYQGMSQNQQLQLIGASVGKSGHWAYGYYRLLKLPLEVQQLLEPDEEDKTALPQALGSFLVTIASPEIQLKVARETVDQELSLKQAKQLARHLAIDAGLKAGSATRSPKNDYNIMRNYLRNTVEGAANLLDMPHRTLAELFEHRGLEQRKQAVREIDEAIKLFERIRKALAIKR